ncbi:putative methyltransferase [Campylobacter sputorum aubsp. sputorum RM3237]|uniref:Bifunctional 3-demethylubiquinone-9 3-methyltransferase/ 2-octaprenyl-6-hydroxy phenol methylase n=1 Tax=Campylobacter sputorum subsp. sputorum TaxID=32024 RepID=A0A381DJC4_9BACT|nr:class I SAM-dependent methyltransferase [Campylobacter sputorum]ASM35741.1 putative methyltransferase [Campylobacter sputorum aubsp. sputorum RM3237]KAB0581442.1 class I SAM-dependent methyltransferase [Campylobacter sputorum subsp. sputorum]SUX10710.1 bifunctional 3-demethylubiquinone-9 3-methyltransferase/ 2-octaprenyl-6-hydroxy phenol methylase [Campylobacter sputorum subsp. sputorum]
MDKLNQELINKIELSFKIDELIENFTKNSDISNEVIEILDENLKDKEKILERLKDKKTALIDEIHLYLDSIYDTDECENYIINRYWQNSYKNKTPTYFQKAYKLYYEIFFPKILQKYCNNFDTALEIGCGNGIITEILAKKFKNVIGIDLSKNGVNVANKNNKLKNVKYFCDDAKNAKKYISGSGYNLVFASDIMMYSQDKNLKAIFEGFLSIINPGGGIAYERKREK